jgi:DNA ligase-1
MSQLTQIPIRRGVDRSTFETEIRPAATPVVLADLVAGWPLVQAARESRAALARAIKGYDAGRRPHVMEAPADVQGRLFYRDDLSAFNFTRRPVGLAETVDRLLDCADAADAPAIFLESMSATAYLPRFAAGHEGLVAKDPASLYVAGRRAAHWLKIKPAHTLDLVVLAVEHGSGRRTGTLSNIHLGARDPEHGGFAMLGKTFQGMTDAMLAWQTARFSELAVRTEGHVVHLDPVQVVEVAFDGVQASSQYPSGLSLRFARVVRYRSDKLASEADTIDSVRALASRGAGEGAEP